MLPAPHPQVPPDWQTGLMPAHFGLFPHRHVLAVQTFDSLPQMSFPHLHSPPVHTGFLPEHAGAPLQVQVLPSHRSLTVRLHGCAAPPHVHAPA